MGKIKVGALWRKEGPYGAFFSGMINIPIIIEENKYKKEGDQQPDLILHVAEDQATVAARKAKAQERRGLDVDNEKKQPAPEPCGNYPQNQPPKRRY